MSSDQALRDLLQAGAPEPATAIDGTALIRRAKRERARRRTLLAAPLLLSAGLVALPVITWPALPAPPDVSRLLPGGDRTAPRLTGRYPASAIGNGQSPAEPGSEAVELAAMELPDGQRLVYVAYKDTLGQHCAGFVDAAGIGLPSGCHPRRTVEDDQGLVFGMFGEQDARLTYNGTVYVWGSAPAGAAYVRLIGSGFSQRVPVTTSDDRDYDNRAYFIAAINDGPVTGGTAHDRNDEVVATRETVDP